MSSMTRSISRGIARKNGVLKPHRGKTPNYRSQIFKQHTSKKADGMFAEMFNAIFGRGGTGHADAETD